MLRILHTSDWHLGHTLCDLPREEEHAAFLAWLIETIAAESVDALLVAGDLYEVAHPTPAAQRQLYEFFAKTRKRFPDLGLVFIGGNHDSAARLDAPGAIFKEFGVHVVGGLPRREDRSIELDSLLIPLADRSGVVAAWVAAVPYLRPSDLEIVEPGTVESPVDVLVEGVRRTYEKVLEAARARRKPGQALIAMGHAYMVGGELSEISERKILGGNQHALPVDIFPADVAYTALGHLHKFQQVGDRNDVRYSGSPIPLSMTEASYEHQVLIVDLEGEKLVDVRCVAIPRSVSLLRIPEEGPRPLDAVLERLAKLDPRKADSPEWKRPFLEVQVTLTEPDPSLKSKLEKALDGKEPRLIKISPVTTATKIPLASALPGASLKDLQPSAVFERLYAGKHPLPVPADLIAAFHDLQEQISQEVSA